MRHYEAASIAGAIAAATVASTLAAMRLTGISVNDIAATVAILAFVMSITLHFLINKVSGDQKTDSVSQSMCLELYDTLDALNRSRYPDDALCIVTRDNTEVYFMNRYLVHDIYGGKLSSGDISLARMRAQKLLHDAYSLIKDHNRQLDRIMDISIREGKAYPEEADPIYKALDAIERKLLRLIPETIKELGGAPEPSRRPRA